MAESFSAAVRFKPWVGENYQTGRSGKRVLVLGESHYQGDMKQPIDDWTTFTIHCIEEQLGRKPYKFTWAFWTKIAIAFLNKTPSMEEKRDFWHSIAFYNYIQRSLSRARVRPSEEMWRSSGPAFAEVLEKLKPHVMIVLGKDLWSWLPGSGRKKGPEIACPKQSDTWWYSYTGGTCLAYGVYHPSSRFSGRAWHPFIMKVISLA